ncbi:hypothetical protein GBA52_001057 [Prunus armeniaca]|nr:hypothetical protein GBA52_001057 [Prunus armeniaca]
MLKLLKGFPPIHMCFHLDPSGSKFSSLHRLASSLQLLVPLTSLSIQLDISNNLSYVLEIKSGDMILYSGFQTPQPYWSMAKENRKTINKDGGVVTSASISENSWKFYDRTKALLWQFISRLDTDANATWIAVLGSDGFITFKQSSEWRVKWSLQEQKYQAILAAPPEPCDAYFECYSNNKCPVPFRSQLPSKLQGGDCLLM